MTIRLLAVLAAAVSAHTASAEQIGPFAIGTMKTTPSATVTACDRLTAYRNDDGRVAAPVARADIDLSGAIAACEVAITHQPDNPRLHYQLARALGYDGQTARALEHRRIAAEIGYPAAIFVLGIVELFSAEGDACTAARLMEAAARRQAYPGLAAYPAYRLQGRFDRCEGLADTETLLAWLAEADARADDYYKHVLVQTVRVGLEAEAN